VPFDAGGSMDWWKPDVNPGKFSQVRERKLIETKQTQLEIHKHGFRAGRDSRAGLCCSSPSTHAV
jgi:hypothetical protein